MRVIFPPRPGNWRFDVRYEHLHAVGIVSPDEMNRYVRTVIIAPLTSTQRDYPTRVKSHSHSIVAGGLPEMS